MKQQPWKQIFAPVCAAVMALALSACGPGKTPTPDGGIDGGAVDQCTTDNDCGSADFFDCAKNDQGIKVCKPVCKNDDQCKASVRGEFALDECAGALGCTCDTGECKSRLCGSDAECGNSVCRNGQCSAAPAASSVTACRIFPDFAILRGDSGKESKTKFYVSAWAGTEPVVLTDGYTWSAVGGGPVSRVDSGTAASAEFKASAASSAAADAVQVTVGSATCIAKVQVVGAPGSAKSIGALVVDELTGRPIDGATLFLSHTGTGADAHAGNAPNPTSGGLTTAQADTNLSAVNASVFHADYSYVTLANVSLSGTGGRLLQFALRRHPVDRYGGYRGTFTDVPLTAGKVSVGLAGAAISGALTGLSVTQLLGPSYPTEIKLTSTPTTVPLPTGLFAGLGANIFKKDVAAQGLASTCTSYQGSSSSVALEDAISKGKCGTTAAWALTGNVPLEALPLDQFLGGTSGAGLDIGKLLTRLLPLFRYFNSSVGRDVEYELIPTPKTTDADGTVTYDLATNTHYTTFNHDFDQVRLGFDFVAQVPDLPKIKGDKYPDGLIILGGAQVPGRGLVPLGIGAALNDKVNDSKTDANPDLGISSTGLAKVRMAPTHHGLENAPYLMAAVSLDIGTSSNKAQAVATSVVFSGVQFPGAAANGLVFDPTGKTPLPIAGTFLGLPLSNNNTLYNFTDTARGALAGRQFKFSSADGVTSLADASVLQVVFADGAGHDWVAVMDAAQASSGLVLPKPPAGFEDRTLNGGTLVSGRSAITLQAIRLVDDRSLASPAKISFNDYVEFNDINMIRAADFASALSVVVYGKPALSFVKPDAAATVAAESKLTFEVGGFRVGADLSSKADGYVSVTFKNAQGSPVCSEVTGKAETVEGKGEVLVTLPAGCSGAVTAVATLVDFSATPIEPAISVERALTIQ